MLSRLVIAAIIGILTAIVCIFVGTLLMTVPVSWAAATGAFLKTYGALFGLLAALWHFFTGGTWTRPA